AGLEDCVAVIGQPINNDEVSISFHGAPVFTGRLLH
ncbi:phosphoribosylformylglycinamidine synthase, partial [Pseudomonas syringae pv. pisi str. 1704B]